MHRWRNSEWTEESDEEVEEQLELDPNDPSHPDYDLSVAAGYAAWEPPPRPLLTRRGVMLLVALLVIAGLMIPVLAIIV